MQINIKNGSLTLGSIYKLIFAGWLVSWGVLMGAMVCLVLLTTLLTGSAEVNGEVVQGRGAVLAASAPIFILLPIILFFHALMFSGLLTLGVWLYRKFRPITVVNHDPAVTF